VPAALGIFDAAAAARLAVLQWPCLTPNNNNSLIVRRPLPWTTEPTKKVPLTS
jgi:hypothetical protein